MTQPLTNLYLRDLDRVIQEIGLYTNPEKLWIERKEINNSGGNLVLHIAGNLQHFIGSVLGDTNYKRDRTYEFAAKNVDPQQLINEIAITKEIISGTLPSLSENMLQENYPLEVFGTAMTVEYFLIHLYGHLNYHLGQISYHRRLI